MKDVSWSPIMWAPCNGAALDFAWEGRVDLKETRGIPQVAPDEKRSPAWPTEMEIHWHAWKEGRRGRGKPWRRGGKTERFTAVSWERGYFNTPAPRRTRVFPPQLNQGRPLLPFSSLLFLHPYSWALRGLDSELGRRDSTRGCGERKRASVWMSPWGQVASGQ